MLSASLWRSSKHGGLLDLPARKRCALEKPTETIRRSPIAADIAAEAPRPAGGDVRSFQNPFDHTVE